MFMNIAHLIFFYVGRVFLLYSCYKILGFTPNCKSSKAFYIVHFYIAALVFFKFFNHFFILIQYGKRKNLCAAYALAYFPFPSFNNYSAMAKLNELSRSSSFAVGYIIYKCEVKQIECQKTSEDNEEDFFHSIKIVK